jgi:hypothetical protein
MVGSQFVFEPSQSPRAEEKSIVGAKRSRVSEAAELVDLLGDGEP